MLWCICGDISQAPHTRNTMQCVTHSGTTLVEHIWSRCQKLVVHNCIKHLRCYNGVIDVNENTGRHTLMLFDCLNCGEAPLWMHKCKCVRWSEHPAWARRSVRSTGRLYSLKSCCMSADFSRSARLRGHRPFKGPNWIQWFKRKYICFFVNWFVRSRSVFISLLLYQYTQKSLQ